MRYAWIVLFVSAKLCAQQPAPIAGKIVEFSVKNLGKKIDRGECWDLANAALNYAQADWEPPLKFGDKVEYQTSTLKPGDVLQFSNIKMKFPNGSMSFPKHTAIVYKAKPNQVTLLHQNFNNKRYVDTLTISFDYIKAGKIEAFRPKGKV
ncbi:MAG: CHAP domain-containing protein [Bacteroidia bacterium]